MIGPRTTATEPPLGRKAERYRAATLLDSYGIVLPRDAPADIERLAHLALGDPPAVVRGLMSVRDTIMSHFGVRTSREARALTTARPHIDFFPVLACSDHEIELGFDDRHLDFRAWLTLGTAPDGPMLRSTTAAWAHNLLGRSYLRIIEPVHEAIVRSSLRRVVHRLS